MHKNSRNESPASDGDKADITEGHKRGLCGAKFILGLGSEAGREVCRTAEE